MESKAPSNSSIDDRVSRLQGIAKSTEIGVKTPGHALVPALTLRSAESL